MAHVLLFCVCSSRFVPNILSRAPFKHIMRLKTAHTSTIIFHTMTQYIIIAHQETVHADIFGSATNMLIVVLLMLAHHKII